MENTSGQGKEAQVPDELKGWNWGGFFLTFIWGAVNKVYISFLVFVPVVGILVSFYLGAKGNALAWQSREWESVEQFKAVQRKWGIAGLVVTVIFTALWFAFVPSLDFDDEDTDALPVAAAPTPSQPIKQPESPPPAPEPAPAAQVATAPAEPSTPSAAPTTPAAPATATAPATPPAPVASAPAPVTAPAPSPAPTSVATVTAKTTSAVAVDQTPPPAPAVEAPAEPAPRRKLASGDLRKCLDYEENAAVIRCVERLAPQ